MSTRHIARTLTLQTLFEIDMRNQFSLPIESAYQILERNRAEFGEGVKDVSFAQHILENVLSRKITIDDIITRAAPDWPLEKISSVDRNILRVGLSELLFGDRAQVPPKVAIDEAIELAKAYGGDTSGKFVNGVLGAIYKEMGEPEKDQITKKKHDTSEGAKKETLGGSVVYSFYEGTYSIALVHDVFGYWTLPKGHITEENIETGIKKAIKKEIGIDISLVEKLGENEYIANKPDIGKVIKHVVYYLAKTEYHPLSLENKSGLDEAKWFPLQEVASLRMYDDIKPLLHKASQHIIGNS